MPNKKCAICAKEIKGVSFDGAPLVDSEVCDYCYDTKVIHAKQERSSLELETEEPEFQIRLKDHMDIYISNRDGGWMVRIEAHGYDREEISEAYNSLRFCNDDLIKQRIRGTQWLVSHLYELILEYNSYYYDHFIIYYYLNEEYINDDYLRELESGYYEMLREEEEE